MSTIGAVLGSFLNFFSFSRKHSYIAGMVVSVIAAILIMMTKSLETLYLGLFLAGLGSNQVCIIQFSILAE